MSSAALQKSRREQGLCLRCGAPANPGKPLCETHRLDALEKATTYYYRNRKEIARKAQKTRDERLAKGLCVTCGTEKPEEGKTQCGPCAEKGRIRTKRYAEKVKNEEYCE